MDPSLLLALLLLYLRPTLDHHRPRHPGTLRRLLPPLDGDHLHDDWGPSVASTASDAEASSVAPKTAADCAFAFLCASGELPEDYDARQLRKQQKKKKDDKGKKRKRRARRRDARKDAAASTVPKKPASPEDSSKSDDPKPSESETSASESFAAESFAPASPLDEELPDDAARRLRKKEKKKQYQKLKKIAGRRAARKPHRTRKEEPYRSEFPSGGPRRPVAKKRLLSTRA